VEIISKFQVIVNSQISPIFDGKIHRFGKKDEGWYVGHQWDYKGNNYQIIRMGSWNGSIPETKLKSWDYKEETTAFKKKLADTTREAQAKLKIEKSENQKACVEKWFPIFKQAKQAISHDYLTHKGIDPFLARIDYNGVLLIPSYNQNGFTGVQRIYKDPEAGNFMKKFSFGIEIEGSFCPLSKFKTAEYCYVSEGYATSASIQMAFPDVPSICVFNAGNIERAIATIRFLHPKIKIIIAADRDFKSKTGERYARQACTKFSDVIFKMPDLSSDDWSDFNDLHQFNSLQAVKDQLKFDESDFTSITCLGYNENNYYYTSTTFKQILSIPASAHSKSNFFSLAEQKYWAKRYGFEDENGRTIVSYDSISSDLMAKCREVGVFNPENIRGVGIWKDDGQYVINDGEKIFPFKKTQYHYQVSPPINYDVSQEMTDEDAQKVVSSFSALKYKNPKDAILLTAFIAQAQVFSILPWRFHVWLSGEKGTGKSKILEWTSGMIINPNMVINTTVSGIIQNLRNDAKVTVYEEAEAESGKMTQVIELARQMSTLGEFKVLRGSASGKVITNNTNTIFLFGSIQVTKLNAADRSRIFLIEMDKIVNQSQETYDTLCDNFRELSLNKNLLFARCFNNINVIIKNFENISKFLKKKIEPRMADQIGMALSCYSIMHTKEILDEEKIISLINYADIGKSAYKEQNEGNENADCLGAMFDVVIDSDKNTIGGIIEKIKSLTNEPLDTLHQYLNSYGLKFDRSKNNLFVCLNASMEKALPKHPDYLRILRRSEKMINGAKTERINGTVKKGIVLNIE